MLITIIKFMLWECIFYLSLPLLTMVLHFSSFLQLCPPILSHYFKSGYVHLIVSTIVPFITQKRTFIKTVFSVNYNITFTNPLYSGHASNLQSLALYFYISNNGWSRAFATRPFTQSNACSYMPLYPSCVPTFIAFTTSS